MNGSDAWWGGYNAWVKYLSDVHSNMEKPMNIYPKDHTGHTDWEKGADCAKSNANYFE